jgi:hypothetical protein
MEFGDTGCADHEQSPPHQRTHAAEHYAKLINRNGRYGRFRHASSLPKPTRTAPNLTPGISRSPNRRREWRNPLDCPPFVRFTWFAEVRYPPEMGREPDTVDQAAPFGIGPREGAIQGDIESPWSEASLRQQCSSRRIRHRSRSALP